jgi:hypothetical protein
MASASGAQPSLAWDVAAQHNIMQTTNAALKVAMVDGGCGAVGAATCLSPAPFCFSLFLRSDLPVNAYANGKLP